MIANTGAASAPAHAIHLERTECMGNECATYTIDIAGDGGVTWTGGDHVLVHGSAHAQIPVRDVERIVGAFRAAKFFALDKPPRFYADCSLGTCVTVICETTDSSTTKLEIDHHALELFDCRGDLEAAVHLLHERVHAELWIGPSR